MECGICPGCAGELDGRQPVPEPGLVGAEAAGEPFYMQESKLFELLEAPGSIIDIIQKEKKKRDGEFTLPY